MSSKANYVDLILQCAPGLLGISSLNLNPINTITDWMITRQYADLYIRKRISFLQSATSLTISLSILKRIELNSLTPDISLVPRASFWSSQWLSGKMVRKLSQGSHVRIPNMWETPKMWKTLCPRASPGYDTPTNPCVWTPSGFPVLKRIQKTHWYS